MTIKLEAEDPLSTDGALENKAETGEEVKVYSCDFCEFKTGAPAFQRLHVVRVHKVRPCHLCHFYADTLPNLNFHQETCHAIDPFLPPSPAGETQTNCDVCDSTFKTLSGLKMHVEAKHKGVRYPCEECDFQTSYKTSLKLHIEAQHEGIQYSCDKCEFTTGYRKLLGRHILSGRHLPNSFQCEECEFQTAYRKSLKLHIEAVHDGVKYSCDKCDFATGYKRYLKRHKVSCGVKLPKKWIKPRSSPYGYPVTYSQFVEVREGEEDEKKELKVGENPHTADENGLIWCQYVGCDFRSKYYPNVKRHELAQHLKVKFKCDKCEFTAAQRAEVLVHSESKHEGIIHNCESCDFKTPWKSFFKKHQVEKHGANFAFTKREPPQPYLSNPKAKWKALKKEGNPQYNCTQCDFSSPNLQILKYHSKRSKAGIFLSCDLCDYKNCNERGLTRHKRRIHKIALKVDDTFSCNKCDFKSQNYVSIKIHMKNSKSKHAVKCEHCDYKNCYERGLNKHKAKVHQINSEKVPVPQQCPNCDYSSSNRQLMGYHLKGTKAGRLFKCKHCEYKHCSQRGLNFHEKRTHKVKSVKKSGRKCPRCDYTTAYTKLLDSHLAKSKSEVIHKCSFCDYKNCSELSLAKHQARIHKTGKTKSKLECPKCGATYKSISGLDVHKSKCLGLDTKQLEVKLETPLEKYCDKCDFKSVDPDDFYEHVLEHLPTNTLEPQKLSNSFINNLTAVTIERIIPEETEIQNHPISADTAGAPTISSDKISSFKEKLKNKLRECSDTVTDEGIDAPKIEPGEIVRDSDGLVVRDPGEIVRDSDGQVVRDPGEIVRDADGQVVRDPGEIVRDSDGQVVRDPGEIVRDADGQVVRDPGEIVRDADGQVVRDPGEIVRDSDGEVVEDFAFKSEIPVQEYPEHFDTGDTRELDAAVEFLMSLDNDSKEEISPTNDDERVESEADEELMNETDYEEAKPFQCDFECGSSFLREEDLYIHITDYHNNF